jgi:hypothetical protein
VGTWVVLVGIAAIAVIAVAWIVWAMARRRELRAAGDD